MSLNSAIKNHDVKLHTDLDSFPRYTGNREKKRAKVQISACNTLLGVRNAPKYTKLTVVVLGRLKPAE